MSVKVLTLVWALPLNPIEKIVALAIADAGNDKGYAYPGYKELMPKTSLGSRATLSKTIKILVDAGLFTKQPHGSIGKGRKVNTYQFDMNIDHEKLKENLIIARKNNSKTTISTPGVLNTISTPGVPTYPSTPGVLPSTLCPPKSTLGVHEPLCIEPLIDIDINAHEDFEIPVLKNVDGLTAGQITAKLIAMGLCHCNPSDQGFLKTMEEGATQRDYEDATGKALCAGAAFPYMLKCVNTILLKRKSQNTAANGPGSNSTLNTHNHGDNHERQGYNNATHSSTGRKLNSHEREAAAQQRFMDRELRERGENARTIN
jgi:hypothetical protein